MRTLYCSLVRPLLEYSCETWNPCTKRTIDKLEAVQRRANRLITRPDDDNDARGGRGDLRLCGVDVILMR